MLLGPQRPQGFGDPAPHGREAMHAGVAGGADGDEALEVVAAGLAVVDGQPFPAPAGLALAAVAVERRLALAREAPAGMRAARVAAAAEAGDGRQVAAGAEERALAHGKAAAPPRSSQESQSSRGGVEPHLIRRQPLMSNQQFTPVRCM